MITKTDNSSMLILALKKGDTEGYRQLLQNMGEAMHQYAQRIVGDPGTAQDIVQDALLRLYKFRKKLDTKLELRGLCFRIVRNLSRSHLRDINLRRTRETEAEDMRQSTNKRTPELAIEAWDCAEQLSDDLREVIDLRFTFGLSRAEIAAVLEIPEGSVATLQRRALSEVKQKLTARSVSPAMLAASPLSGLLASGGQASLSNPYPLNILNMENVVMTAIRRMKMKTAGLAASAALVLLFLTGVVGLSLAGNSEAPNNSIIAQQKADSESATQRNNETIFNSEVDNRTPNTDGSGSSTSSPEGTVNSSKPRETPLPKDPNTPVEPANLNEIPTIEPAPVRPVVTPKGLPPAFDSVPPTFANVGEDYLYMIETHGQPSPAITADKLPKWLTLDGDLLSGAPTADFAGKSTLITLRANNGVAPEAMQRFQLLVGTAPQVTSKPVILAEAPVAYSYSITVTGTPAPKLSAKGLPAWLTLKASKLVGTPAISDGGVSAPITITASNGSKPDATQTFSITVNTSPVFASKPVVTVKAGVEYRYDIKLNGTPAPTLYAKGLPSWLTLTGNVLSGTPRIKDIGKSRQISLKAKNGIGKPVKQKFNVVVAKNPNYVEMPWTLKELRKYFKVGLKWSGEDHGIEKTARGVVYRDKKSYEVTKVVGDAVTVKIVISTPKTATSKITWVDRDFTYIWSLKDIAAGKFPYGYAGKVTSKSKQKLVIAGKTYQCHVFEIEYDPSIYKSSTKGYRWTTQRLYMIEGKPGIAVKIELIDPKKNETKSGLLVDTIVD